MWATVHGLRAPPHRRLQPVLAAWRHVIEHRWLARSICRQAEKSIASATTTYIVRQLRTPELGACLMACVRASCWCEAASACALASAASPSRAACRSATTCAASMPLKSDHEHTSETCQLHACAAPSRRAGRGHVHGPNTLSKAGSCTARPDLPAALRTLAHPVSIST